MRKELNTNFKDTGTEFTQLYRGNHNQVWLNHVFRYTQAHYVSAVNYEFTTDFITSEEYIHECMHAYNLTCPGLETRTARTL